MIEFARLKYAKLIFLVDFSIGLSGLALLVAVGLRGNQMCHMHGGIVKNSSC